MAELRDEIIETEKARTDFLKWKLIGVSALGAAGLGFSDHAGPAGAYLVLSLIPFVCVYVDLLCRHSSLRILVIGRFLALHTSGEQARYEQLAHLSRKMGTNNVNVFALEDWALGWSTWLLSFLLLALGVTLEFPGMALSTDPAQQGLSVLLTRLAPWMFMVSGGAGVLLTAIGKCQFDSRAKLLDALAADRNTFELLKAAPAEVATEPLTPNAVR